MKRALTPYERDRLHTRGYLVMRLYQAAADIAAGEEVVALCMFAGGMTERLFSITAATRRRWRRMALALMAFDVACGAAAATAAHNLLAHIRACVLVDTTVPDDWLL